MMATTSAKTVPSSLALSPLARRVAGRSVGNPGFWNFADSGSRSGGHALFQYPAMMVPELQGALLDDLVAVDRNVQLVYDPFAGSGTVLLESLYRGLSFHGTDINPMAILLCQVKADPPSSSEATLAVARVVARLEKLEPVRSPEFFGRDKWFTPDALTGLTKLRTAIKAEKTLRMRRFLWVCLAETVRLVSNSRTSTFKLHIYAPKALAARKPDAVQTFVQVSGANAAHVGTHWARINARSDEAKPKVTLLQGAVSSPWIRPVLADSMMTSPPYGDNKTTVPYGQHSYLPLQWIDTNDIPGGFDPTLLNSTARIDTLSLGGSLADADRVRNELEAKSPALAVFLRQLDDRPPLRRKVLAFVRDYSHGLASASAHLRPSAYSFLTLGERRVGGHVMPLVEVTRDLLQSIDHSYVHLVERRLSRKRMASRNSEGSTMATEFILIMRKSSATRVRRQKKAERSRQSESL